MTEEDENWSVLDRSHWVAMRLMETLTDMREQCEDVPFLRGSPACPVFGAVILVLIDCVMNPKNEGSTAKLVECMSQPDWPEKAEVRRRIDALLDGLGLVDDSHLMN